jgi:predicted Kef-type K+ transport protein
MLAGQILPLGHLLIVVGKFAIWMIVVRLFRYPLPTAIAVASGLTQIGELSFILVQTRSYKLQRSNK